MEGRVIGSYQVLRRLGEGGMGVVYEAVHTQIKRRAAIKLLHAQYSQDPQLACRFLNEAKAVNIVKHPGLVEVFEYGQLADKTAYIVMEYLAGETLKQLLERRGGSLSVPEALRWTRQIAGALSAAHARGVVHRDLKPENVMVVAAPEAEGDRRIKVLDFGIAKLMAEETSTHTETGLMMGTPAYMSPEQCLGANRVDDRTDVYSLGAMLYQMLAGRVPFVADGKGALILMHMTQKPQPLRQLVPQAPEPLAALLQRMLAKKREDRPSMTEVAALVEELEAKGFPVRRPRGAAVLLAGIGVLVCASTSAAVLSRRHGPAQPAPSAPPSSPSVQPAPVAPLSPPPDGAGATRQSATVSPPEPMTTKPPVSAPRAERRADGREQPGRRSNPAPGRRSLIQRTPRFE